MTGQAWLMLAVTWSVILYFTVRYFVSVLMTPVRPEREAQARDGILEKDA